MEPPADSVPVKLVKFIRAFLNRLPGIIGSRRRNEEEEIDKFINKLRGIDCSGNVQQQKLVESDEGAIGRLDQAWLASLQEKLGMEPQKLRASAGSINCCIHRVRQCVYLDENKNPYAPKAVSIGPMHRGEERLQAMEEHKWRCVRSVVSHSRDKHLGLESYLIAVKELEERARDCYSETFNLSSKDFVEMMFVDGCFIIDLLCKCMGVWKSDPSDPILKIDWLWNYIYNDLLRLENQIPFIVLQTLFDLTNNPTNHCLSHIALVFFAGKRSSNVQIIKDHSKLKCQHLLHLFHCSLLPVTNPSYPINMMKEAPLNFLHSVTELQQAGVKFKRCEEEGSLLEISFRKGTISIPRLIVNESTNRLFLNLIAFEQCYRHCGRYITSYTIFMDCLINSATDVGILSNHQIIDNWLGSKEEIADLFHKITRESLISTEEFYLRNVLQEINRYYNSTWHVWRAILMRNYFNNPWASISVIAAVILLILSSIQTFFGVVSYLYPK